MNMFQKLEAWFAAIWHHFHAGTLPDPPAAGTSATLPPINPGAVTPPAPPIPLPTGTPGATPTGAKLGDTVFPGVTYSDDVNGLVSFPNIAKTAGWQFQVAPLRSQVDPNSQAAATIDRNEGNSTVAGAMGGVYVLVHKLAEQTQNAALARYQLTDQTVDHAEIIGARFDTWEKVYDFVLNQWQAPTFHPAGPGGPMV